MADTLKGLIVVVLLVFAFGIYPAYRQAEVTERNIRMSANAAVEEFVDTVRSKGYIDVRDYKQFLDALDASYGVFDVQLEYYKKKLQPLYATPEDYSTFQNSFSVRYDGYFNKDILKILYPTGSVIAEDHPSRRFNMHTGDLFNVRLESKGSTLASRMRSFLFRSSDIAIHVKYGGMVLSEAP